MSFRQGRTARGRAYTVLCIIQIQHGFRAWRQLRITARHFYLFNRIVRCAEHKAMLAYRIYLQSIPPIAQAKPSYIHTGTIFLRLDITHKKLVYRRFPNSELGTAAHVPIILPGTISVIENFIKRIGNAQL